MEKRIAIITGATRGIGRGLFKRLSGLGYSIATTYHSDEMAADDLRQQANRAGIDYLVERVDIEQLNVLPPFIDKVCDRFGRADYLVNNVGIDDFHSIYYLTLRDWKKSQDIILNAPFVLSKAVLPIMRGQRFGRIVNIGASSWDFFKGVQRAAAFGVDKAALAILTKTLALEEISYGITVNMVAPGSTTGAGILPEEERIPISQIPIGRRVSIEEVVDAIMYFLSDSAGGVTGQLLGVNGGLST